MNLLDRINDKLTAKNKLVAERPPNSELVLLFGRNELEEFKLFCQDSYFSVLNVPIVSDEEIVFDGSAKFLDMLIIPVDMDDYLDIVRRL